ncbi:MAG: ABC-type Mn2+/Zn2+ transport system ATPase subunit [Candidatus Poriferisodalaceae bacterium]
MTADEEDVHIQDVDIQGLSVEFGPHLALDDITMSIPSGTSLALMGPNGSGKTTLLHALGGLHRSIRRGHGPRAKVSGNVDLGGRTVAYVTQRHDHHPWMPITAREVVSMGRFRNAGAVRRLSAADRAATVNAAERLEVTDLLDEQFGTLSGGQQQRVRVAQALCQEPDLLLLDEPVTGLDMASQQRILHLIDELTEAGVIVVVSTHHMQEASRCSAVALLLHRLIAHGPPTATLTSANLEQAFAGRMLDEHHDHHSHPEAD